MELWRVCKVVRLWLNNFWSGIILNRFLFPLVHFLEGFNSKDRGSFTLTFFSNQTFRKCCQQNFFFLVSINVLRHLKFKSANELLKSVYIIALDPFSKFLRGVCVPKRMFKCFLLFSILANFLAFFRFFLTF